MKLSFRAAVCFTMAALVFAPAQALPGQNFAGVAAQIARKPFTLKSTVSEMSGLPFDTATASYHGVKVVYSFGEALGHKTYEETIAYRAPGFDFLNRRDPRVHDVLALVYSDTIARDFTAAKVAAQVAVFRSKAKATFLRGARYGYSIGANGPGNLRVLSLHDLGREIENARKCATMECGD